MIIPLPARLTVAVPELWTLGNEKYLWGYLRHSNQKRLKYMVGRYDARFVGMISS